MKRIFSLLLILCVCFTAVFPMTAYAAETDTVLGVSDSENAQANEDAPVEAAPVYLPEEIPADSPVETPEAPAEETPTDVSEHTPGEACEEQLLQISPFSEFTGEDNEFFTRIRLTVTDRQGNPLSGVVYGLYMMNGQLVEYLTTDAYGVATSGDVPVDTDYYLEEVTPPTGYAPNTGRRDIILTEVCAPSRVDVSAEYDPIMGRIKVIKTDDYGYPLSDAGFYIYRSDTWQLADTIITGTDGTATTVELPYGRYELYEYLVPADYESSGGYYTAVIDTDGEIVELSIVNYYNPPYIPPEEAYVSVHKTGNDGRNIPGAVFSIYTHYGDWVENITTGNNGYAYSGALSFGEYYAVEKSVPAGYRLDDTPHYFSLYETWQTVYIDVLNERSGESGRVKIVKTDDKENPLSGVVFGLYRAWDNKKLAELTTGEDGTVESGLLIPQDYYLVELSGKDGYEMLTGQIPFTIDETGTTVVVVAINPKTRIFGKVKVFKTDEDGNPLPGVRFGVYCSKDNLLQEMITREDGTAVSGVLNEGTGYYVKELAGLPGYLPSERQYPFSITENNVIVPVTVENPRITGGIKVIKTGENGEPLSGVVFGVYKDNELVQELTTSEDGTAASSPLYYGDYELRELATVDGYELIDAVIPFSIIEQDVIIEIPVANPLIFGSIRILKTDENGTPLPGAVFGLYNEQGQQIAELTTGEDGRAEYGGLVKNGYYLLEQKAPDGFALSGDEIPFAIETQGEVIEKTIVNSVGYGTLKVIKTGENCAPLSGVVFEVYSVSDDSKVAEITTGDNGEAEITLPLARYYLLETKTAAGYKLLESVISFTLTVEGATVELPIRNQKEPAQPEEPTTGYVRLVKKAESTGAKLPGAVFGIFKASNNEKVGELVTGSDGTATSSALPENDYYLLELTAPAGFKLNTDKISFHLNVGETKEITVTNAPVPSVNPDPQTTGYVRLVKQAEGTNEKLSGAVFGIYKASNDVKVAEITTGSDGTATYELSAGDFYLRELKAPAGFKLNADKIGFSINAGVTRIVTVTNTPEEPTTGYVRLVKKAESNGAKLPGAVFGIFKASNNEQVGELVTGSDGTAISSVLPVNDYYLLELTAPTGFKLKTDKIGFSIKAGETKEITVLNAPKTEDTPTTPGTPVIPGTPITPGASATGNLYLIKRAESTGESLSGAVFGIYKASNDSKVAEITTGSDGTATYTLSVGDYYLRELKAPAGFKLEAAKIPFTVKTDSTVVVEVTNMTDDKATTPDITIPKTGESPPYGNYILSVLCMGLAGICCVTLYRGRRKRRRTA